jgi:integrase
VDRPAEPRPTNPDVPEELVIRALDELAARTKKNNRGWKTLARLSVIAHTGLRHSQVMRLTATEIRHDADPPGIYCREPGKDNRSHWKPLTQYGVAACKLFIERKAFGKFSQSSARKVWKLTCKRAGLPFFTPYHLRHTWATTLRQGGLDLADVQELMGHTDAKTTARYAAVSRGKLQRAAEILTKAWDEARARVEAAKKSG